MKWISRFLAIAMCLTLLTPAAAGAEPMGLQEKITETAQSLMILGSGRSVLTQGKDFPAGTSVCDWTAMALALSGIAGDYQSYLDALEDYVEAAYAKEGTLDAVKSTTFHRISLTVRALGGDPTSFGQKPDGITIDLVADGTYAFSGASLGLQGLNGWIYALLTVDALGIAVPEDARFTQMQMLETIVVAQEPDGGFGLAEGNSDVDITAMALQALAPHQQQYPETVEKALNYLSGALNENCGYSSYGAENSESAAQVILALCALGIDPEEDDRFIKGEHTLLTRLDGFRQADGTYGHETSDAAGDHLATAQSLLALIAVQKFRTQNSRLWDLTAYAGPQQKKTSPLPYISGGVVILILASAYIITTGKRKKHGKTD